MYAVSKPSRKGKQLTRGQFLRTAMIGAGALGAVAVGMSGTAKAQPTPQNPNISLNGSGGYDVYPKNDPSIDTSNVQWAITNANPGGTIQLMPYEINTTTFTRFNFGPTGFVTINKYVNVIGVPDPSGNKPEIFSNPNAAIIQGIFLCGNVANSPMKGKIQNIHFNCNPNATGQLSAAVRVRRTAGVEVSYCKISATIPSVTAFFGFGIWYQLTQTPAPTGDQIVQNNEITVNRTIPYTGRSDEVGVFGGIGFGNFFTQTPPTITIDSNIISCTNCISNIQAGFPTGAIVTHGNVSNAVISNNIASGSNNQIGLQMLDAPTSPASNVRISGNDFSNYSATVYQLYVGSSYHSCAIGPNKFGNIVGPSSGTAAAYGAYVIGSGNTIDGNMFGGVSGINSAGVCLASSSTTLSGNTFGAAENTQLYLSQSAAGNTVNDNTFTDSGTFGVRYSALGANSISNNSFGPAGVISVYIDPAASGAAFTANTFGPAPTAILCTGSNNTFSSNDIAGSDISIDLADPTCRGNTVTGNSISAAGTYGILVENGAYGNTVSSNTITNVSPCVPINLSDAGNPDANSHPNTFVGNVILGSARAGIVLDGSSNNNDFVDNVTTSLNPSEVQVLVRPNAHNNYFAAVDAGGNAAPGGNVFGPVSLSSSFSNSILWIEGHDNKFVGNDYSGTGLMGWKLSASQIKQLGCIFLETTSHGNLVSENIFPAGTTICTQVIDMTGASNSVYDGSNELGGLTSSCQSSIAHNTHMAGQFIKHDVLKAYLDQKHSDHAAWLAAFKSGAQPYGPPEPAWSDQQDMLSMGYAWDFASKRWVCPDGYHVDASEFLADGVTPNPNYGYCVQD